jgi:carboxyl-terminal processing protease
MKLKKHTSLMLILGMTAGTSLGQQPLAQPQQQNTELIKSIVSIVRTEHYAPKPIDDTFSQQLWQSTINNIDPLGQLFLKADLDKLAKYKKRLDEELNGAAQIAFLPALLDIYLKRITEMEQDYLSVLGQPADFSIKEDTGPLGGAAIGSSKSPKELKENRRKRIKYLVLQQYYLFKNTNPQKKTEIELEKQARQMVNLRIKRSIENMRLSADPQRQFDAYLDRMLKIMDPHSSYLSARAEREFADRMGNSFGGIGAQLDPQPQAAGIRISGLDIGGSAFKSGELLTGDIIIAIGEGGAGEMREVAGMGTGEVAALIRGQVGTQLRINVERSGAAPRTVTLPREVSRESASQVRTAVIEQQGKRIGYIAFPLFYESLDPISGQHCATDVEQAVTQLQGQNVQAIIIDLRGNGGGSLREAVRMATLFTGQQPIVQVKDNKGYPVSRSATDADMMMPSGRPFFQQIYQGPLAVMVDEYSASASEIFAAAIQDYGRGLIVGSSTSYGKGSVQKLLKLPAAVGGSLQLTYAQFYRANGSSTQLKGVSSDIVIPDLNEYAGIREQDLPDPLAWDMVSPLSGAKGSAPAMATIAAHVQTRIAKDSTYENLAERSKEIAHIKKSRVSLEFNDYSISARRLASLSRPLAANSTGESKIIALQTDQPNQRNAQLLERLISDTTFLQAVRAVAELALK